jgi:hypothetical protein
MFRKQLIKNIIREYFTKKEITNENIQLADKIYFKTGKLTDDDKKIILNITNGDNYTKLITDFYYHIIENSFGFDNVTTQLNQLYNEVINYNKNVFPIVGYDVNNLDQKLIYNVIDSLKRRAEIIKNIKTLPSFALRNLKNDIRKERTMSEFNEYLHDLNYFMGYYSLLSNRDSNTQSKILKKMFKNNTTLDQLMSFVDDKQNFIGGVEFTKKDVKKLSESEDFEIIYEQSDVMIVRVDSPDGIKAIGCNSLWCFTYGTGFNEAYRQWNNHSHNDMVYVLIDFKEKSDSEDFMHVLIKPLTDEEGELIEYDEDNEDQHPIYNMSNENYYNPYSILKNLFGPNYIEIINNYLNFEN